MSVRSIGSRKFNQDVTQAKHWADEGPVLITRRGQPTHVLLSFRDWHALTEAAAGTRPEAPAAEAADRDIAFGHAPPEGVGKKQIRPDRPQPGVPAREWQIQTAKARFSDLVRRSASEGPQQITHHGKPVAVMLSNDDYLGLTADGESLLNFMQRSPLADTDEPTFERNRSSGRDFEW